MTTKKFGDLKMEKEKRHWCFRVKYKNICDIGVNVFTKPHFKLAVFFMATKGAAQYYNATFNAPDVLHS